MSDRQNPPRTLAEIMSGGSIAMSCPRCGCSELLAYKAIQWTTQTVRYRACRNCGHKVLTRQPLESIIRDVSSRGNSSL